MRIKIFLLFLGLLSASAHVNAKELVDLATACQAGREDPSARLMLQAQRGVTQCVDRRAYLSNISIKSAELRYSDALDLYMLFLFVDPSDKPRVADYSRKHLHERVYLIKNRSIELDAELEAPLVNGYINIAVPGESEGRALMDKIVPLPKGKEEQKG